MTDVLRQEIAALATTLVVKVGTQVLTRDDGQLDQARIDQLARQLHDVVASGRKVVLVSSGAVGAGMGRLGMTQRPTDLPRLQAVAAIGQSLLVEAYERALSPYGHHAAQVLLTAEDLEHRPRYLNARNTLLTLLELGAIPIINENDTVSVEELHTTFGDNDRLAAIVTNLIRAPLLVLLSDVDGLCDGDPRQAGSKILRTVERLDRSIYDLVRDKRGGRGKGGMASKLEAARLCTSAGENLIIANGRDPQVLAENRRRGDCRHLVPCPGPVPGRPQALDRVYRKTAGFIAARRRGPGGHSAERSQPSWRRGSWRSTAALPKATSWPSAARTERRLPAG